MTVEPITYRACGTTLPYEVVVRAEPCPVCAMGRWPRCERCESTGIVVVIVDQKFGGKG